MSGQENQTKSADDIIAALTPNPEKIDDGIWLSQWQEWDGEIITLNREGTRWVWKQLKRLQELEKLTKFQDATIKQRAADISRLYDRIAEMQEQLDQAG